MLFGIRISFSRCGPLRENSSDDFSFTVTSTPPVNPSTINPQSTPTPRHGYATTTDNLPKVGEAFSDLRKKKKTIVDKTHFLNKFLHPPFYHQFSILSRPPRFGKTFFLDMMDHFFRGDKQLFEGTAIYQRGNIAANEHFYEKKRGQWLKYPVIRMNFKELMKNFGTAESTSFETRLKDEIQNIGAKYQIDCGADVCNLIQELREKFQLDVVILIDEFDTPIDYALNVLKDTSLAEEIRNVLAEFFGDIKAEQYYIKLTFVVGVTQVHLSLYFENDAIVHYDDLTYDKEFTSILGFTPEEVETFMMPHIQKFSEDKNRTFDEVTRELIQWYEGHRFSLRNETRVLNPVSVIECLRKQRCDNYWCSSDNGSLAYIIDTFIHDELQADHFANYETDWERLLYWGPEGVPVKSDKPLERSKIPIVVYMLVHGYLTIIKYSKTEKKVTLGYPNDEVRKTIASCLECARKGSKFT